MCEASFVLLPDARRERDAAYFIRFRDDVLRKRRHDCCGRVHCAEMRNAVRTALLDVFDPRGVSREENDGTFSFALLSYDARQDDSSRMATSTPKDES